MQRMDTEQGAHNIATLFVKNYMANKSITINDADFDQSTLKPITDIYDNVYYTVLDLFSKYPDNND